MDVQDSEDDTLKRKSDRYGKIAIVFSLLLALFWALGAFIIWILSGLSVYFAFLFFYYQPQRPKDIFRKASSDNSFSSKGWTVEDDVKRKAKLGIQIAMGFFAFFIAMLFIIGLFSNDDSTSSDEAIIASGDATSESAQLLKPDPANIDAMINVGNEFFDQRNYDSALFYYNKVLSLDSRNSAVLYNKGLIYYNEKQYLQSIDLLKNSLSVDATNKEAMYVMGHNYYDRQLYDDALYWYRQAYEAGMRDAFLSHALGFLYDEKGNNTKAIFHYQEALQQDSSRTDIYVRLAEMQPDKAAWYKAKEEQWKK